MVRVALPPEQAAQISELARLEASALWREDNRQGLPPSEPEVKGRMLMFAADILALGRKLFLDM